MPEPHDHLRELLRGDPERVAFLVGPQVARQAVAGSPVEPFATREGLIRSGLERAVAAGRLPARPTDLPTSHRSDAIGAAARDVERTLLDPPDELAHRWLRDTVGAFIHHVRRPRVLEPLAELPRLGIKLVTTNHDLLLEEFSGLPPSTWRDETGTQARDRAVLHLHGVWHQPESVVLGALPTDIHRHVEAIQALVAAKRWIVCVGYDGEHRSILGGFLRWLVLTASPATRFFHLCTNSEAHSLLDRNFDDWGSTAVPYGRESGDLASFLRSLISPQSSMAEDDYPAPFTRGVPSVSYSDELLRPPEVPPEPTRSTIERTQDRRGVVSTGVSTMRTPEAPLSAERSLQGDRGYYLWLEVGAPVAGSMELTPSSLPASLPQECVLQVVLFTNPGSVEITGPMLGELRLTADGSVNVHRPASLPEALPLSTRLRDRRLFFAVRTPAASGVFTLRIGIYHRRVLVQSRLLRLHVTPRPETRQAALSSEIDYSLVERLTHADTAALAPHTLSILLNADDDDARTHSFRFLGEGDLHGSASLDAHLVQDAIRVGREALRRVAWGNAEPWDPRRGDVDRHAAPVDFELFRRDLALLARAGYRLYDLFASRLRVRGDLEATVRRPGTIQFALKDGARAVFPVALIYDHPLDTGRPESDYVLCPAFCAAVGGSEPLHDSPCLRGECPHRDDPRMNVVCPGGFWGFRHKIGVQPGLEPGASVTGLTDAIAFTGAPSLLTTVSTDPHMRLRETHLRNLYALVPDQRVVETREESLVRMRGDSPHVVYFYCHGGRTEAGHLCLELGPRRGSAIARDTLRSYRVRWTDPRALVVLNGCHTVDVEPEKAIEMVSGFLSTVGAAGVVGTEITVFEPLATRFAEGLLHELVRRRRPIGEAVRTTRHRLLRAALNPLGLVYIPFALASLRLVERAPT